VSDGFGGVLFEQVVNPVALEGMAADQDVDMVRQDGAGVAGQPVLFMDAGERIADCIAIFEGEPMDSVAECFLGLAMEFAKFRRGWLNDFSSFVERPEFGDLRNMHGFRMTATQVVGEPMPVPEQNDVRGHERTL